MECREGLQTPTFQCDFPGVSISDSQSHDSRTAIQFGLCLTSAWGSDNAKILKLEESKGKNGSNIAEDGPVG